MTAKIYPLNEEKLDFLDYDDYGLDESQLIIFKEELKKFALMTSILIIWSLKGVQMIIQ